MMFRQAIQTRYVGPTNFKGSRIRVKCDAKTFFVGWRDELSVDENHHAAAMRAFTELGWDKVYREEVGALVGGCMGNDYYFVSVQKLASGLLKEWE